MSVCLCVCCTNCDVCVCEYLHAHVYICVQICACVCVCEGLHAHVYVCVQICACVCVCVFLQMVPPCFESSPAVSFCTRFAIKRRNRQASSPINDVVWTPDGHRLLSGTANGEFILWDDVSFKFSTIQLSHNSPINCMQWNRNETFLVSGGLLCCC